MASRRALQAALAYLRLSPAPTCGNKKPRHHWRGFHMGLEPLPFRAHPCLWRGPGVSLAAWAQPRANPETPAIALHASIMTDQRRPSNLAASSSARAMRAVALIEILIGTRRRAARRFRALL